MKEYRNQIMDVLKEVYQRDTVEREVVKNKVVFLGISPKEGTIVPNIYVNSYFEEGYSVEEAAFHIHRTLEETETSPIIEELESQKSTWLTPEYLKENLRIGYQQSSGQLLIKRESMFEGIEEFLYVTVIFPDGENAKFNITPSLLEKIYYSVEQLWEVAMQNTCNATVITSMIEKMQAILGYKLSKEEAEAIMRIPLYVITNSTGYLGAAGILAKEKIQHYFRERVCDTISRLLVIPSSTHEMLVLPIEDDITEEEMEYYAEMIGSINESEYLSEEEILSNRAYVLNIA